MTDAAKPADSGQRSLRGVRGAALEALVAADTEDAFVDDVLPRARAGFDSRDRGLLQELVYGVIRQRGTLDRVLDFYLKLPLSRQRPAVRWALRLGAYQLVFLARIPAHAALHQTVDALKAHAGAGSRDGGFANAILHRLAADIRFKGQSPGLDRNDPSVVPIRDGFCHFARPVLPLYSLGTEAHLAAKYSYPRWLVARWLSRFGEEEARALFESSNLTPSLTARLTARAPGLDEVLLALRSEGFDVEVGLLTGSIVFRSGGDLDSSDCLQRGWFQVQDVTAQAIGALLQPPRGARVLDLCAAPGGKAGQLLDAVGESGHLVACDRGAAKLGVLRESLTRLGTNFTLVELPEAPEAMDLGEQFTHVLADAPCSNTGVLARRPDARWRLRTRDVAALAGLQERLLEAAVRHLAPGGRLVYSTCSLESEENEERVAALVARHPDLTELSVQLHLPHRHGGDGGYGALLRRASAAPPG